MNTTKLDLNKLHPFAGHPYKVQDNEEMDALVESIRTNGILTPLTVRPLENGEYKVVSGHRRLYAAQKAGLETVPSIILPMSRDEAAIAVVDSNLHREHLLPSEKAFAYKLKMEALSHQGKRMDLTSSHPETKLRTDELLGKDTGESRATIQRYIRLTYLIPELLDKMDEGKIALSVGVELSFLCEEAQYGVLEECERNDCTPSYSQAFRMKKLYNDGRLSRNEITRILSQEKANQVERLKIPMERIRRFFPKSYTTAQIEEAVVKLCERDYRRRTDRDR